MSLPAVAAAASGGPEWQLFHSHLLSLQAMVMLYLVVRTVKRAFYVSAMQKQLKEASNIKIKPVNMSKKYEMCFCDPFADRHARATTQSFYQSRKVIFKLGERETDLCFKIKPLTVTSINCIFCIPHVM